MMDTKDLAYNANDIEIRNNNVLVLKPKWCYPWYDDDIKYETLKLKKFYRLKLYFARTVNEKFKHIDEIHVEVDGDYDIRESPSIPINEIHNIKDLRSLISEALFRVSHFDVGGIPSSLLRDKRIEWVAYKHLTVSISYPDAVASLFSDEWLTEVLHWVEALKKRES